MAPVRGDSGLAVLSDESSTAALGLLSVIVVQLAMLAPLTFVVAFIIWTVRRRSGPRTDSETQYPPTGKKFDRG
ncbi:hypothetical protein [Brevibacterium sp. FME17]|uniref:hypothetical protein n=1 Tax=Brevibacterium sp. FME17 TaxID=2742606 RepID=UPI00186967BA|nr:hypothetical protein [Brevibacterium sp. FME17]